MTTTGTSSVSPNSPQSAAVRLDPSAPGTIVPITRGGGDCARTVGVVLVDATGSRWQRTVDLERLLSVATIATGMVAATGFVAAAFRRPTAHVDRLTMGPGGWVSFRGGKKPEPHGLPRPWWAVVLRARPLGR